MQGVLPMPMSDDDHKPKVEADEKQLAEDAAKALQDTINRMKEETERIIRQTKEDGKT